MKPKFQKFNEWIKIRDKSLYVYLSESDTMGRRDFLKSIGTGLAGLTAAGLSQAETKDKKNQPDWLFEDLKKTTVEFDVDENKNKDYDLIIVTMRIPNDIKLRLSTSNQLLNYCKNFTKNNRILLEKIITKLKESTKNENINSSNLYIHAQDVTLRPYNYRYDPSHKNVKFVIEVSYHDPSTGRILTPNDLSKIK